MKLIVAAFIFISNSFCYSQNIGSIYFKEIKSTYNAYLICEGKVKKQKGYYPISIQTLPRAKDTLLFKFDFFGIYGSQREGLTEFVAGQEYLIMKIYNDCVFLDYDPKVKAKFPELGLKQGMLADLNSEIKSCHELTDYFLYDKLTICLETKSNVDFLRDTIYIFRMRGNEKSMTHVAYPKRFLFTKKDGFIAWELGIEKPLCRLFYIDKSIKRKQLKELISKISTDR